jgi:hypothetical protein
MKNCREHVLSCASDIERLFRDGAFPTTVRPTNRLNTPSVTSGGIAIYQIIQIRANKSCFAKFKVLLWMGWRCPETENCRALVGGLSQVCVGHSSVMTVIFYKQKTELH